jgi:hypothetical protein
MRRARRRKLHRVESNAFARTKKARSRGDSTIIEGDDDVLASIRERRVAFSEIRSPRGFKPILHVR